MGCGYNLGISQNITSRPQGATISEPNEAGSGRKRRKVRSAYEKNLGYFASPLEIL